MSLDYYYEFKAAPSNPIEDLRNFLTQVGEEALQLGFATAVTVNSVFRSVDQLQFARRICLLPVLTDARLKTADFSADPAVDRQDRKEGECGIFPVDGILLVVVNQTGLETTFGFLRFPKLIVGMDDNGTEVRMEYPVGSDWQFRQWVQSPDPRYRKLVSLFAAGGYLADERDDYRPK